MLHQLLDNNFTIGELQTLADSLGVEWDNLEGGTRIRKATELAKYMERYNRSYELLAALDLTGKGLDLQPYLYLVILDFFGNREKMEELLGSFGIQPRNFGGREKFSWGSLSWLRQKAETLQAQLEEDGRIGQLLAAIQAESQDDIDFTFYGAAPPPVSDDSLDEEDGIDPSDLEEADQYHNFDLDLEVVRDVFRVEATGDQGEVRHDQDTAGLRDPELHELLAYMRGLVARDEDVRLLGQKLNQLLFPPAIWTKYKEYLQGSEEAAGLRIRLRFHESETELLRLPWEYCRDDRDYFALNTATPVIRYLKTDLAPRPIDAPSPVRLLIATASPKGYDALGVEEEAKLIQEALKGLNQDGRPKVEVKLLHQASMLDLDGEIASRGGFRPHILHFIGHGELKNGQGHLVMNDGRGDALLVNGETLLRPLRDRGSLVRVVVLNACLTAAYGSDQAISGLAPYLVWGGIPAVIAMQFPVPDQMATVFAENLYGQLAGGAPLDEAITTARRRASYAGIAFWGIPALYMRSPDGVIWQRR